jgi:type IV secretory pathway VirB3-like protein
MITLLIKTALRAAIVLGLTLAVAGCVSLFAAILITNAVVLMPLGTIAQIAGLSIYTCAQSALDGFPIA